MGFENVGKTWLVEELQDYLVSLGVKPSWCKAITLHHTYAPSLAQRPNGLTTQHINNIQHFYETDCNMSSGPHFFVDDKRILGMSDPLRTGAHARSFNGFSLGIEVLGNYDTEDPLNGRGLNCWLNAAQLTAILANWLGLSITETTIKFHREDPKTQKTCPGTKVNKAWFIDLVRQSTLSSTQQLEKPDVGMPWTEWDFRGERWCVPLYRFLTAKTVQSNSIIAKLKFEDGKFYYGEELLEGAYYLDARSAVQPNQCTWVPAYEALDLVRIELNSSSTIGARSLMRSMSKASYSQDLGAILLLDASLGLAHKGLLQEDLLPARSIELIDTPPETDEKPAPPEIESFCDIPEGEQDIEPAYHLTDMPTAKGMHMKAYTAEALSRSSTNIFQGNGQDKVIRLTDINTTTHPVKLYLVGQFGKLTLDGLVITGKTITIESYQNNFVNLKRLEINNSQGLVINGLNKILVSSQAAQASEVNSPLVAVNSKNCTVTGLIVQSVNTSAQWQPRDWRTKAKKGIIVAGENCLISKNAITNVRVGIEALAANTKIVDNKIHNFCDDGIRPLADGCSVTNNDIRYAKNSQENNHCDAIQMWKYKAADLNTSILKGITINNNTIYNITPSYPDDITFFMQGIVCFNGRLQDSVIKDNLIINDHEHGISVRNARNCQIIGNKILSSRPTIVQNWLMLGVPLAAQVASCVNNKVVDNKALTYRLTTSMVSQSANNETLTLDQVEELLEDLLEELPA
ncbi:MAG: N-acetylmuramoyl-L-alanine amidase [Thiofilum sp.]|uniref:N-acetylmuramoyl-L-alanine amidase n=1 Tax=Thiofilum sp. TaxID=2212733 RepID=UPI0025F21804|nr:N-acetylmuramoyl-L-alanine amidase [Thiofilum sp.]MBK8453625.1 N-acetylmuramoyl-L-alanine amidase [Thiofilum sp.]